MSERFPDYDVLAKRHSPSWNEKTRQVIDAAARLAARAAVLSTPEELHTLEGDLRPHRAPAGGPAAGAARGDGRREAAAKTAATATATTACRRCARLGARDSRRSMPRRGAGTMSASRGSTRAEQDALLRAVQEGESPRATGAGCRRRSFSPSGCCPTSSPSYYAHPTAWNEIGFGGPASPRGYVRMDFDRRDPWEAAEAEAGP